MANVKISQLTPKGANLEATDLLEISEFDGSGYVTRSITGQEIIDAASGGGGDMLKSVYDPDDTGIVLSASKEMVSVINNTGGTISKGSIVYLKSSSSSASHPEILLADADTEATSTKTIGAVYEDILDTAVGYVVTSGEVDNLDTALYNIGDKLWLSQTPGEVTTTPPVQPAHTVFIGTVTRSQGVNGRVLYAIQNGYELNELHDVKITSIANDDIIQYDSATSLWKNESLSTAGIQPTLVSGTNIKTINGSSVLGSGDLVVGGGGGGTHVIVKPQTGNQVSALIAPTNSGFNVGAIGFRMQAFPFYPASSFTCSSLTLNVTTLIAGGIARILIYSDLNGKPSVKLYESANLDCSTTGLKTASTTFNFVAGTKYWITVQSNNASIAFTLQPQNFSTIVSSFGLATRYTSYILASIAIGSAPATWTGGTLHAFEFPFVYITSA